MDDSDWIVVDDEAGPSAPRPVSVAEHAFTSTSRLRSTSNPPNHISSDASERTTRSSITKSKPQPKLKLKLSEKAAAQAPGMSFLGQYDRELDSDDEDLLFEEQFILRMPPGEDLERLRKTVASREVANDVWFKFKDSRRAAFHIGNSTYSAKLVDLPCIVESQKTLDNKQMFKAADICQMLVVEKIDSEDSVGRDRNFNFEEFIWPHGVTPPLHHVRKRRFRKRVNKRTIESVEQEVERLLDEDSLATEVKYDILDNVNPDLSDSEFIDHEEPLDAPTPAMSDLGDGHTPRHDLEDDGDDVDEGEEEEGDGEEGDIDEELAAELDLALGDGDEGEGDDEDDESEEEEDDDEDDEEAQARKLVNEEIRDLEAAVAKKNREISSSANPLIKKRFEDALKKLTADLEMKLAQRDEMQEKRLRKENDMDADVGPSPEDNDNDDDDELFGSGDPSGMMDIV